MPKNLKTISNNEVIVRVDSIKETKIVKAKKTIIEYTLDNIICNRYNDSDYKIKLFGKPNIDFRIVVVIGDPKSKNDINAISSIDLGELDKSYDYGEFDITKSMKNLKTCYLLKFNEKEMVEKILRHISKDSFNGGYFAKGKFMGTSISDIIFVGISGDIKNEKHIRKFNLDDIPNMLPKLTKKNDFVDVTKKTKDSITVSSKEK